MTFQGDIIIGRDFLEKEKLTFVYEPIQGERNKVNLFTRLPLYVDEERSNDLEQIIKDYEIDYDLEIKNS